MVAKISPEVTCIDANSSGIDLATLIHRFDIDVVHSCIWWADRWVDSYQEHLPEYIPWIITMHGCHESILRNPQIDVTFAWHLSRMKERASWVYTAQKNLEIFMDYGRPSRLSFIPNGIASNADHPVLNREGLGLRQEALVLCLASRAISSKGWSEAVRLTERLNNEGHIVDLLLIGEGPLADSVRLQSPMNVYQVNQVANIQSYLRMADIGLLPTYFEGESFPLVLLEMMAVSLPIVASDIGEIPSILGINELPAGLVVPALDSSIDEEALFTAVCKLLDPAIRQRYAKNARSRYECNYTIQKMVDRYACCYSDSSGCRPKIGSSP